MRLIEPRANPRQTLKLLDTYLFSGGSCDAPFTGLDATAGVENELQAVVEGPREAVDLPLTIEGSTYYANLNKRLGRGELPRRALEALDEYLGQNPGQVWENSWVRLPLSRLAPGARATLERDLLADKSRPEAGRRGDCGDFFRIEGWEQLLRVPVSYLLKLSLAQAVGSQPGLPALLAETGRRLQHHFSSDNTSPETFSFHVASAGAEGGLGPAVGRETAKRFLLTHLLAHYAWMELGLRESRQKPLVYFAPQPPVRQKQLNAAIPDSFYRELFMSPCLSGWDRGEEKHRYMHLCHQVLSRSHLNTLIKLKEAGIIQNNLVVLPQTSNISLANNGTHVSLGSRLLSKAMADPASGFAAPQEKAVGDLAIKFVEHFLPLFVGTYSAAPYRLDFEDFHPERVLGFLPHELDYTHLRMLWRRWKKKARLKAPLGLRLTPFGPPPLDRGLALVLGLKGDLVPDFRLLDYMAAVLSTEQSPALDGRLGNLERLKNDLAQAGVFDERMAPYLLYRQREYAKMGFSGFEGRHYSLFPSLERDLAPAVDLQALITALAFRLIAAGRLTHDHIPDDPQVESERRQIFFGAAVGVPTFYVHRQSGSRLLHSLVAGCRRVRISRRYPNYLRVYNLEYRLALVEFLRREAADLCRQMGGPELFDDLEARLSQPGGHAAHGQLCGDILRGLGRSSALKVPAAEFNQAAEAHYREELRRRHLREGLDALARDLSRTEFRRAALHPGFGEALSFALGGRDAASALSRLGPGVMDSSLPATETLTLINLLLISFSHDERESRRLSGATEASEHGSCAASVF